jgi:phage tail sheath protein FI
MSSRINILAIPGIRDSFVTDHTQELVREYGQAIYLIDIPSYDKSNVRRYDDSANRVSVNRTIEKFEGRQLDNNFTAAYFPDVAIEDDENNNRVVNVPASVVALGALGFNDSVAYPWFAPAGFNRGSLENVRNTDIRLTAGDRDNLYEARINPIANFPNGGFVIFGQKTLQQDKTALDRVNVRRMLLEVKRLIVDVANKLVFEQNTPATRARFVAQVTPLLSVVQSQQGIDQFKVVMDSSNNTDIDIENNVLNGRIVLVPTRAVEFIAVDFIITNSGVSFA